MNETPKMAFAHMGIYVIDMAQVVDFSRVCSASASRTEPDGTVEIDVGPIGLLNFVARGATQGGYVPGKTKRRVLVKLLEPWECAGFGVDCDADLFAHLVYGNDAQGERTERALGPAVPIALLVERDGMKMTPTSLAFAMRYIWIALRASQQTYSDDVRQFRQKDAAAIAQCAAASAEGAAKLHQQAEFRKSEWRASAAETWRATPEMKADAVANLVRDELRKRNDTAPLPSFRTVRDAIKGVKSAVVTNRARANKRSPPTV